MRGDVGVVGFYVYGDGAASTSLEIVPSNTPPENGPGLR